MTSLSATRRLMILFLAILLWNGCSPITGVDQDEEKNPHFLAGKSRINSMDYTGAIDAFEKALEANPRSASAHFQLGLLYYQRVNDYATAIYHYQKHLKLRPKSNLADTVRVHIGNCKVEIAKTVPFSLVSQQVHAQLDRLTSENAALRQQVEQLKAQLAQQASMLSNRPVVPPNSPVPEQPSPVTNRTTVRTDRASPSSTPPVQTRPSSTATTMTTYVVKRNETLAKIARDKGISLSKLQEANPGVEPRRLKAGQAIKIPAPTL